MSAASTWKLASPYKTVVSFYSSSSRSSTGPAIHAMSPVDVSVKHKDEDELARLGYKQELKRDFGFLEVFGLALSCVGAISFSKMSLL